MKRIVSIALIGLLSIAASFQMMAQTKIIKGDNPYGDVLYNFDGQFLRSGKSEYSEVIYNWDGQNLRKGNSKYATILYNFDGKNFRQGDSCYGKVLYNWDGQYLRQGESQYGNVLYNCPARKEPVFQCSFPHLRDTPGSSSDTAADVITPLFP